MTTRTAPKDVCGWQYALPGSLRWLHGLSREIAKAMRIDRERVNIVAADPGAVEIRIVNGTARECITFLELLNEDLPLPIVATVRGDCGAAIEDRRGES